MSFLLDEDFDFPKVGDKRTGWVIAHRNNEILIDVNAKSEGIIPNDEVSSLGPADLEALAEGNEVTVYIIEMDDNNGDVVVSYAKAQAERDWVKANELMDSGNILDSNIIGYNRGGLLVKLGQLRGFVPNSQLSRDRRLPRSQDELKQYLSKMVGEPISVKVIEVNQKKNRLILSELAASREMRQAKREKLLESISEDDVFEGRVVNLANFGAFVDIGGIEGLVHLSELSWKHVNNPSDMLKLGDMVKVSVISVDQEKQRIALSMKRLEADPWTTIDDLYQVGQLIEATITRLTKFGAFARLNDEYGLEGLIHISELTDGHIGHHSEVLNAKDKLTVRIIRIDPEQRQLGLSLRQVTSQEYMEADLAMLSVD